jgi:ribosome-binding protein aMBF1 (putative translation factor)
VRKRYPTRARVVRDVLTSIREATGLSQEAVSLKLRESKNYLHYIEANRRGCSIEEFIAIVEACGADPVDALQRIMSRSRRR